MIAYCGLNCLTCAIYLATRERNKTKRHQMRVEIAEQIKKHYGQELSSADVADCDGCKTENDRLFCSDCQMRTCAKQKDFESCAYCDDYACEKLEKFFITDTEAKKRLERIRSRPR